MCVQYKPAGVYFADVAGVIHAFRRQIRVVRTLTAGTQDPPFGQGHKHPRALALHNGKGSVRFSLPSAGRLSGACASVKTTGIGPGAQHVESMAAV